MEGIAWRNRESDMSEVFAWLVCCKFWWFVVSFVAGFGT